MLKINFEVIEAYEPFIGLEIRAVTSFDNFHYEWVNFNDPDVKLFSVYGISKFDQRSMCIARCLTLKTARDFAQTLNIFASHSLIIHEYPKV